MKTYISIIKRIMAINLLFRLSAAFTILFAIKNKHWFIIRMDNDNLKELIQNDNFKEIQIMRYQMKFYNVKQLCKCLIEDMDSVDWIIEKAIFEAESENVNK